MPHRKKWFGIVLQCTLQVVLGCFLLSLSGCGFSMRGITASARIDPVAGEDLAGPCKYDLLMLQPAVKQNAVLVVYERGDSENFLEDYDVQRMTELNGLAIVFAHQCNAASFDDIQSDATQGPGRMLFAALSQFAVTSGHPELGSSQVILFGFSAAGVLSATTTHQMPQRVLGTIEYAMASAHMDVSTLSIPDGALHVPTLVIANATDSSAGTEPSLTYFQKGRNTGAIWGYGVQNHTGHCCTLSTKKIVIPWIEAVLALRPPTQTSGPVAALSPSAGTVTSFICTPDGTRNAGGDEDCNFSYAGLGAPAAGQQSSWLPNQTSAAAWLHWVTNPHGN